MYLRIFLVVIEVLFITILNFYMASEFVSLDVLYCLPVIQAARFGALQVKRDSESHTLTIVAILCAIGWSVAEAAVIWPYFPISAFLINIVTRAVTFALIGRVIAKVWKDKEYSRKDWLTGLPDRMEFIKWFESKQKQSEKSGMPYSLLLMNLDGFRAFNDKYGYQVGDQVLVVLAKTLLENSRNEDAPARIGSDEFLLFFSDTDSETCKILVERLLIELISKFSQNGWDITLSCGQITEIGKHRSVDELLHAAGDTLYSLKNAKKQIQN
jgi:diguanylate cyclase (GGDEF)-like protein